MRINKISHYAIPKECKSGGVSCPIANADFAPRAWFTRYDELNVSEGYKLRTDVTGAYTPQGACTDGEYIYRALVMEDDAPTMLQKLRLDTGELVTQVTKNSYGHANDMTFAKGKLYIAHSSSTSTVYEVDPNTFDLLNTFEVPLTIWGIAYDPVNDLFIFGGVGSAYFSVYYPDFKFMYRIKPENPFTGLVRQGITTDGNYIYVALDNAYGAVIENEKGSRIMVYTLNGMFIKSLYIPIAEIEWAFPHNNYMYIGTYNGRNSEDIKSGDIYKIPFDLYPEQTVLTGRPTDVSGGLNNLQRLPEGTPVRLWDSEGLSEGVITLDSKNHGVKISESSPFRYYRFRFRGANEGVFDWYPVANGIPTIREVDITDAVEDSTIRIREIRLQFNESAQTFTILTNKCEQISKDFSENTIAVTKVDGQFNIKIHQIWGVV